MAGYRAYEKTELDSIIYKLEALLTRTLSEWRHLIFKGILGNFLIVQSLRPKKVIPTKKTLTTYLIYRLPLKFTQIEKKIISHWPVCEFRPKNRIQVAVKV